MDKNDPQFLKMAIKSDLMRVAQSAGRLTVPESYDVWMVFLNKAAENMKRSAVDTRLQTDLKNLSLPKELILRDSLTRIRWAEKVLDIACRL